jgi:hypothetical protein
VYKSSSKNAQRRRDKRPPSGILPTLKERIVELVKIWPGLTDREITDRLEGVSAAQQPVNQAARALAESAHFVRRSRSDGKIGNYLSTDVAARPEETTSSRPVASVELSEDDVKRGIEAWLADCGWRVVVKWGKSHGIDIEAHKGEQRWIIEAKGCGSLDPMRVNYFLSMLGELLQRMDDPRGRYSIAMPDMKQFRGLWSRLPDLAKTRTTISALFVDSSGHVEQVGVGTERTV